MSSAHPTPHDSSSPEEPTPLSEIADRLKPVFQYVSVEIWSGILLLAATIAALIWANSPWHEQYFHWIHIEIALTVEGKTLAKSAQHWINDGLMTLFFFMIGLEIKRELVTGRLRDPKAAALPALAALGGMAGPALVYVAINAGGPALHGWAIPMATDIAFAVGVLALLGKRIPPHLRLFLLTLAIVDDIGCIAAIALFYSSGISFTWLGSVVVIGFLTYGMRRLGFRQVWIYVVLGIVAWFCTLMSGVHATIAGVLMGVLTPAHPIGKRKVLEELEHIIHPWVAFLVVPVFAFVNAGVHIDLDALGDAFNRRITWGTAAGLIGGKTLGIILITSIGVRLGFGRLPEGVTLRHVIAMAPLAGIGFTVSLMIAALSLDNPSRIDAAKIGILTGSIISAILGYLLLRFWAPRPQPQPEQ